MLADELSEEELDPIPKYLFHRDVLRTTGKRLASVRSCLDDSRWVQALSTSQWEDGSWGRFHTQDTKRKQPIPTTECAIRLALASGLDGRHPVVRGVVDYIERVLRDGLDWRDWHEKHDNPDAWPWSVRHISAANLASIEPTHPLLAPHQSFWLDMAKAAFGSGDYSRVAEMAAFNDLTGYGLKNPPRVIHRNPLLILSTVAPQLGPMAATIGRAVLDQRPAPDTRAFRRPPFDPAVARDLYYWIEFAVTALAFEPVREALRTVLRSLQGDRGMVDLGGKLPRRPHSPFPLSETWRKRQARETDHTIWITGLLSRCLDEQQTTLV